MDSLNDKGFISRNNFFMPNILHRDDNVHELTCAYLLRSNANLGVASALYPFGAGPVSRLCNYFTCCSLSSDGGLLYTIPPHGTRLVS